MPETASFEPRPTCERCLRPSPLCWCAHLPALEARTRVVILQHPRERRVAIGTARMASLCLPGAELHVGAEWSEATLTRLLTARGPAALLYPGAGARDVTTLAPAERPGTLVVVDGTWSHAKNVVRASPALAALPRLSFVPERPSEYRIRREPRPDYVSTIEALAHVLGALEDDPSRFTAMLAPFRAMVDMQLDHVARVHTPRSRRARPRRGPRVPPALTDGTRLVCVATEASAWPHGSPERAKKPLGELLHVVAASDDGDVLDQLVAIDGVLAPGTTTHSELDESTLAAAPDTDALRRAFASFVRAGDVVVHWASNTPRLLVDRGLWAGPFIDLRLVLRALEPRKPGAIDDACARRDIVPPRLDARGRAARRAAALMRLVEHVRTLAARP